MDCLNNNDKAIDLFKDTIDKLNKIEELIKNIYK